MEDQKLVVIKLFFNITNNTHYVQIGDNMFPVRASVVTAMQEKEQIHIRRVESIKQAQLADKDLLLVQKFRWNSNGDIWDEIRAISIEIDKVDKILESLKDKVQLPGFYRYVITDRKVEILSVDANLFD